MPLKFTMSNQEQPEENYDDTIMLIDVSCSITIMEEMLLTDHKVVGEAFILTKILNVDSAKQII